MIFIVAVLNTNVFACAGEGKKSYDQKQVYCITHGGQAGSNKHAQHQIYSSVVRGLISTILQGYLQVSYFL